MMSDSPDRGVSLEPTTAREAAFAAITSWLQSGRFVAQTLDALPASFAPLERRLAYEIATGVVRRFATLDALIAPFVNRPRDRVEDDLWTLLQVGVYQIVFLEGIPPHAAVHETVELSRRLGQPRWTGFANAVLRKVSQCVTREPTKELARNAVPIVNGLFHRTTIPVFPDPKHDFAAAIAAAFSLPQWLVERWLAVCSKADVIDRGFWFNTPPRMFLRVNRMRTTREELLSELHQEGVEAEAGSTPESIRMVSTRPVESLPGYRDGKFSVQDESAMRAAVLLNPSPGSLVLDLCAAPGTKTTHLAEIMQNTGRILATDSHAERLTKVRENSQRLGLSIIEPRAIREDGEDIPDGPFDAILIDAPCSNTGVLGRRPEARWRLNPDDIGELSHIQRRLLSAALARLKPGGRLVYSTCSIEPEENGRLLRSILESRRGDSLREERMLQPGKPADGGYQALVVRE